MGGVGAHDLKPDQGVLELRAADGRVSAAHVLAVEVPLVTVAVPEGGTLMLAEGARLGVSLPGEREEAGELAVTAHLMCPGTAGATIVALEVDDRAQMERLGIGDLRNMLNERESFRSAVFPGTVVSSVLAASGPEGRPVGRRAEVLLVDVSFDGVGLLVDEGHLAVLADAPFVHVGIVAPEGPPIEVVGAIRHTAPMLGGARVGVAAGVLGARWPEAQELALRRFVLAQQRLGIERR